MKPVEVARLADLLDATQSAVQEETARRAARELRRLSRSHQELALQHAGFSTPTAWMAGNGEVISAKLREEWHALGRPEWLKCVGGHYRCRLFTIPLYPGPRLFKTTRED